MPALHLLFRKEDIDRERLPGQIVVVIDVLFATTTIACALETGVREIWPASDREEALRLAGQTHGRPVLAGEFRAETLEGFAPAVPLRLSQQLRRDDSLVYCTTNGTVALRLSSTATAVYAGALVNGAAVAAHIVRQHPDMPVLVVCAGSLGRFCLEDLYGAGHIVSHFMSHPAYVANDAAQAAMMLYRTHDARAVLSASRVGRMVQAKQHGNEIDYAAAVDTLAVVPRLLGDRLIAASGTTLPLPRTCNESLAQPPSRWAGNPQAR